MHKNRFTSVLIIEDNDDDSFFLTRQFAKTYFEVTVTVIRDGQEALDYLLDTEAVPELIFLDLNLPGLTGIELLERIRQESAIREIPVVVMTGSIEPSDVERCSELGISAYLPKPIDLTTFLKIVNPLPVS
jgi:CheY-like chemotaxis protein